MNGFSSSVVRALDFPFPFEDIFDFEYLTEKLFIGVRGQGGGDENEEEDSSVDQL